MSLGRVFGQYGREVLRNVRAVRDGLPRGNITIVTGGPGSGKTTLGLEFIYRGARELDEPGIIVTFEVSPDRLIADAETLGWELRELEQQGRLKILPSRPVFRDGMREPESLLLTEVAELRARHLRRWPRGHGVER